MAEGTRRKRHIVSLSVGRWMQQQRERCKLTQHYLADTMLRIGERSLRSYEAGERFVDLHIAEQWCAAIDIPEGILRQQAIAFLLGQRSQPPALKDDTDSIQPAFFSQAALPQTSFVGREVETADLTQLMRQPNVRLLTLYGVGGVGKTRLAAKLAANLMPDFVDVFWVSLDDVLTPNAMIGAIQQAIGAPSATLKTVIAHLERRRILLVLDSVERLVADVSDLVQEILTATPDVKVLVTSRAVLKLLSEYEYEVEPLTLPQENEQIEPVLQNPAVQLFAQRVQSYRSRFSLDSTNFQTIVRICRKLDGIPLALELAAARSRSLSLEALAQRLDQSMAFLAVDVRDMPARQLTLRRTLLWSFELLPAAAQDFFAQLSIFVGGWTLVAASAVTAPTSNDIVPLLEILHDNSLIRYDADSDRYTMLDTVREFGREMLVAHGEEYTTKNQHAQYFASWLEEIVAGHPHPPVFVERQIKRDYDNLCTALEWFIASEDAYAGRMCRRLWRVWYTTGRLSEAERFMALTLPFTHDSLIRSRLLDGLANVLGLRGDYTQAYTLLDEALQLNQQRSDIRGEALILSSLGINAEMRGLYEDAYIFHIMSLTLAIKVDYAYLIAADMFNIGNVLQSLGNLPYAAQYYVKSRETFSRDNGLEENKMELAHVDISESRLHTKQNKFLEAVNMLMDAADPLFDNSEPELLSLWLNAVITLGVAAEEYQQAIILDGALRQLGTKIGLVLPPVEQLALNSALEIARCSLDSETVTNAMLDGQRLSIPDALALGRAFLKSIEAKITPDARRQPL